MSVRVLLGDEAVALGAIDAGISAAYAYPGTPSTEILEFVLRWEREAAAGGRATPHAAWCANEKTAYEAALGVSIAGRRSLVAMKHVGLNVAADPFINSALVAIHGGLVVAVADDPGMHSSQNEQDSRVLAEFARVICLEPRTQQEAYAMTREAFDLSERFGIPVLLRLVTRLAHSRASVRLAQPAAERPLGKRDRCADDWILLPSVARRRWRDLLKRQRLFMDYAELTPHNDLQLHGRDLGVITAGVGWNYYAENAGELVERPSHLHIGAYPIPVESVRRLAAHVRRLLVVEDGYPFVERSLRSLLPPPLEIGGRESGDLPLDGELTPDTVRRALRLPARERHARAGLQLPDRPPQLCAGCPHTDTFEALQLAFAEPQPLTPGIVTSDIGCYTLAALPPLEAVESCVCMGASIGMARGASEAGLRPAVAVIGDSTFLHSGVTPLIDAVASDSDMTLVIADNEVVAMTGAQPTLLPSSRLQPLVLGLGVDPAHCHVIDAHPRRKAENAALIRRELDHRGLSVIIAARPCVEAARARKAAAAQPEPVTARSGAGPAAPASGEPGEVPEAPTCRQ
jgi:indolepyruvate ferredoxin oxidoreductase alpha subunit